MKSYNNSFLIFLIISVLFFPFSALSIEGIVFKLKREEKKNIKPAKKTKPIPERFKRKSFTYSKDFVVFNETPKSSLKPGTFLRINIPYPLIASFNEEFPLYGIVVSPFSGIVSGKIKGVKNTNKALISFDEIITDGQVQAIQSFPVFIEGNLKESLFKDIALNFFESLPSVLALALRSQLPQAQIHFINSDLKNKMGKLSTLETEKKRQLQYLEFKDVKLFKVVIK